MTLDLYEFQKQDVAKIEKAGSGVIGSEMGTGKTLEGIALDEAWYKKGGGPTLVIAPLNTHISWQEKYSVQSPDTDVTVIDRYDRGSFFESLRRGRGDVFVCHWEALRLIPELSSVRFNVVIADEGHKASNRKTQQTQALKRIKPKHRLIMSGTLSGDNPMGLWSPLNWVWPSYYRSYWKFMKKYTISELDERGGYNKIVALQHMDELREEMAPWYVRHLKREKCCEHHPEGVMPWLPEKSYNSLHVDLSPKQRTIYEQMRKQMVAWVGEHEDTPLVAGVVIAQLTRLSQIALGTPEIKIKQVRKRDTGELKDVQVVELRLPSSKLDAIVDLLDSQRNKKFLLWSSSKQFIYMAQKYLNDHNYGAHALTGDTPQGQRNAMIENWHGDSRQVMCATIGAAGEGIDGLQYVTDHAIFADRAWSTVQNMQAEDRLHRDGQKNTVTITDIIGKDTVDLGRHTRLEEKWSWVKQILGDR